MAHVFDWLVYDEKSPFLNEFCVSVANRKTTKCDCLYPVINSMDASPRTMQQVSCFVVYFSRLHKNEQVAKVKDWKKYSDSLRRPGDCRTYCLLILAMDKDEVVVDEGQTSEPFKIRNNSLLAILGKGRAFWSTC